MLELARTMRVQERHFAKFFSAVLTSDGSDTRPGFSGICDTRTRPKPDPIPDGTRRVFSSPKMAIFSSFFGYFTAKITTFFKNMFF